MHQIKALFLLSVVSFVFSFIETAVFVNQAEEMSAEM